MSTKKQQKSQKQEELQKSTGLNRVLWVVAIVLLIAAAVSNVYLKEDLMLVFRVLLMVVLGVAALGVASQTNQGKKGLKFFKESRGELRQVIWPTRQEATQTTLIVVAITVIVSLILWAMDGIILSIVNFLTNLRF